jgi:hypothetical protein
MVSDIKGGASLRVFEKMALRRIFGPERDEVTVGWKNFLMRNFLTCILHQVKSE